MEATGFHVVGGSIVHFVHVLIRAASNGACTTYTEHDEVLGLQSGRRCDFVRNKLNRYNRKNTREFACLRNYCIHI